MELTGERIGTQRLTNHTLVSFHTLVTFRLTFSTDQTSEGGPRRIRRHLSTDEADQYLNSTDTWRLQIIK